MKISYWDYAPFPRNSPSKCEITRCGNYFLLWSPFTISFIFCLLMVIESLIQPIRASFSRALRRLDIYTHTHTRARAHIYIYILFSVI